ncbi:ribosome maturation factor RimM [Methylocaldum marinum]|uniref:Ribosome maturation factor RimM n=1 Tax=Methylocaldum marinum TaxID=1432792 RepID=A0A250KSV5_9GAMM|nr:ribosome maturation factor RimM [Methylocaldum marinum]BBA34594.1 ribosome maturation factor RimM [Methylocaldum marinum]
MAQLVVVGEIGGAFGVRGWLKVRSYTDPADNILSYSPWLIGDEKKRSLYKVIDGQQHGGSVLAHLEGVNTRDQALQLTGLCIFVDRDRFEPAKPGEFYWADLVGIEVRTTSGMSLGAVTGMMETGANDVMVVRGERERLIPFVIGEFVKKVDLSEGYLIVDWDSDF